MFQKFSFENLNVKFSLKTNGEWIAAILGMNETLAGVTIVALGNAGPDIEGDQNLKNSLMN